VRRGSLVALCAVVIGCGMDQQERVAPPTIEPRLRLVTDEQFANAVRDLVGVEAPAIHTPGSTPHQLVHEEVLAIDGARWLEYRMAAEAIAKQTAPCELPCALDLAERAFRRPLDDGERERIERLFAQGGSALVVEAVLQAPSFLYRTELGAGPSTVLTSWELASALAFFFYDSLPDAQLRAAARDGSLVQRGVLEREVDRLLAEPRVRDHLVDVVLRWLEAYRVLDVAKNETLYPELTPELRARMFGETERFVRDVLFERDGSLRELLTSSRRFVDERLAAHYGSKKRGGILTHASMLTALASASRQSIILRGKFVNEELLCTPELGRPPFDAIVGVAAFTSKLTESQFAHYRVANAYCATCHRIIDPPGRALERYDGIGRWRSTDEIGLAVEDEAEIVLDGVPQRVRGAFELGELLAESEQVARCAVERLAQHAFGRHLDRRNIERLLAQFEQSDKNLVELFRAIALSPAFRERHRD
jgi:hypothetical protein